jgi:hypothetical protein
MWAGVGLVLSVLLLVVALRNAAAGANEYAREVYYMTKRTHLGFGLAGAAGIVLFTLAYFTRLASVPLLAVFALLSILYFSSFARGFSEDE